jgi:hypothetical protein
MPACTPHITPEAFFVMTPLACELLEDVYSEIFVRDVCGFPEPTLEDKEPTLEDKKLVVRFLRALLQTCKFFECTDVWPLTSELAVKMADSFEEHDRVDQRLAFLPAPQTWVEYEQPSMRHLVGDEGRPDLINGLVRLSDEQVRQAPYRYRLRIPRAWRRQPDDGRSLSDLL